MASTALIGCTGMVSKGTFILSTLRTSPSVSSIDILARRELTPPPPPPPSSASTPTTTTTKTTTKTFISTDTSQWAPHYSRLSPAPQILFSALATTRAAAGSFSAQYALEHGLNLEMARAAKSAHTKVYVLTSAALADPSSAFAYNKMKGQLEQDVTALGFEHLVILRPGLIAGNRAESRPAEALMRKVAWLAGKINTHYLKDGWAQEAEVVARAAVSAGLKALKGEAPSQVWVLSASDIVRLGRTEWEG